MFTLSNRRQYQKCRLAVLLFLLSISVISCQTAPPPPIYVPSPPLPRATINHTVAPGETLWRISKVYNVPSEAIISANHIDKEAHLKMGQKLSVPNAQAPHQSIPLFPSHKWKYIIVHHSATGEGNSLNFNKSHLAKGWDGVGYQFVINNGKGEKRDGFVEITPRWLKQLDGAHCKASDMNLKAIGICLVGNFNHDRVTDKQMQSLIDLINTLRRHYKIPANNILGHHNVRGSKTDCPGTRFPWEALKRKLGKE